MRAFLRALSAEMLKLKRTLALWLALLAPLLVVVLSAAFVLRVPAQRIQRMGLWPALLQGTIMWAVFLLPLVACLLTALLNGVEHRESNWKQLFALPAPRWSVYAAKAAAAYVLLALGSAVLWSSLIGSGYALHALAPKAPLGPAPWIALGRKLALIYAASGALIAIHLWVSARSKGFPLPLGVGVGAVLVSLLGMNDKIMKYWPWMFPTNTTIDQRWVAALVLGVAGGVVITVLGALDLERRDIL